MDLFNNKIMIIGASGFGREVLTCVIDIFSAANKPIRDRIFFLETRTFCEKTKEIHGFQVIPEEMFQPQEFLTVVGIGESQKRKKIVDGLPAGTEFATLIHPTAIISEWVKIGTGSIITAGTILTTDIEIGKHAQLNLHTTVGHDCNIGDYFTTAPGTNISGLCTIGECVYFGTNSSVKQEVSICDNVTIGMGAVVVKDVEEAGIYVGNPATKLAKKKK